MRLRFRALGQVAVLAMGCGTATFIVQQYDGPPRPKDQIALLRLNGKDPVRIDSLDGERLDYQLKDKDARVHIELLPGTHELAITDTFGLAEPFRFVAAAGHVYRPILNPVYHPGSASFVLYEVDASTDEALAAVPPGPDVKRAAAGVQRAAVPPSTLTLPSAPVSGSVLQQSATEASVVAASSSSVPPLSGSAPAQSARANSVTPSAVPPLGSSASAIGGPAAASSVPAASKPAVPSASAGAAALPPR